MSKILLTQEKLQRILVAYDADPRKSIRTLAKELGYSRGFIAKHLELHGRDTGWKHCIKPFIKTKKGYLLYFKPEHPCADKNGYVYGHILKAYEVLGRSLKEDEVVHHINGNTSDNRNSNLLICSRSYHGYLHSEMSRRYQQEHFV